MRGRRGGEERRREGGEGRGRGWKGKGREGRGGGGSQKRGERRPVTARGKGDLERRVRERKAGLEREMKGERSRGWEEERNTKEKI